MTNQEISDFINSMTFEDCTVLLYGRLYWCLGLCSDIKNNRHTMMVYEEDSVNDKWIRTLFDYASTSRDDCMKHFLYDKYWDGKSFYEVAHDMEWIDL